MQIGNTNSLAQRQEQRQQLSAKTLQSLELLHLPILELEARLNRELEVNPVLEELPPELPLPDGPAVSEPDDESRLDERGAEADEWSDELPLPSSGRADGEEFDYLANSPAPPPPLGEQLERELATCGVTPRERELALAVISSLDKDGYLATPAADLAMSCDADLAEIEAAIRLVQSIGPAGVGARDLGEALKLQLERSGGMTPLLEKILDHHLRDIERNKLPKIAHDLGVTVDEVCEAKAELGKLNPKPGAENAVRESEYLDPELEIFRGRDGEYAVRLLTDRRREVVISERYLRMLDDPTLDAETKTYIRERVQRARELLQALDRRKSTLEKLGEVIVATQRDFLDHGKKALHPLTMKQAGEMMHVDESVVSRAAADKLIRTPQGVFPCRYFFSSGFSGSSGNGNEAQSSRAVMERIRELIGAEDPAHPRSDDALAATLKAEGVDIARRTVAKYRELMHIPSSSLRRRH